jgi:hypothetical protein
MAMSDVETWPFIRAMQLIAILGVSPTVAMATSADEADYEQIVSWIKTKPAFRYIVRSSNVIVCVWFSTHQGWLRRYVYPIPKHPAGTVNLLVTTVRLRGAIYEIGVTALSCGPDPPGYFEWVVEATDGGLLSERPDLQENTKH